MTVTELRAHAKELSIKGYSRMNKAELEAAIGNATVANGEVVAETVSPASAEDTKAVFDRVVEKQEEMTAAANAENIDENNNSPDLSDVHFTLKMNGMPRYLRRKALKLAASTNPEKRKEASRLISAYASAR